MARVHGTVSLGYDERHRLHEGGPEMSLLDDLQEDRDTQIKAVCIAFFLIAFPVYFNMASSLKDVGSLGGSSGPVGNYSVDGTYSYHAIGDDIVYVEDGTTVSISANSDAGDVDDDLNIVGVRVSMTYAEDETSQNCLGPNAPDDISGTITHGEYTNTSVGQNPGSHAVEANWHDNSIIGTNVSDMSESEIIALLDGDGVGFGVHDLDIMVTANQGPTTPPVFCNRDDGGEEVEYIIELVSLEYTITPVE